MIFTNRRSTWLELFFDLLFVLIVGTYAGELEHHFSLSFLLYSAPFFFIIWWQWLQFTFYYDVFNPGEWGNWISILIGSFLMLFLADTLNEAIAGNLQRFIVIIFAIRLFIAIMYTYKIFSLRLTKDFHFRLRFVGSFSPFLYGVLFFVDPSWQYLALCIVVFLDMLFPWVMQVKPQRRPLQQSHMEERVGLFMLIVLGEMVTSNALALRNTQWTPEIIFDAFLFFGTAYFITLNYFSYIREHFSSHIVHRGKLLRGLAYTYLQSLIAITVLLLGVSGLFVIRNEDIHLASIIYFSSLIAYLILAFITQSIVQKLRKVAIRNRVVSLIVYVVCLIMLPHSRFLIFLLGFLPLFISNIYMFFTIYLPKMLHKRKKEHSVV